MPRRGFVSGQRVRIVGRKHQFKQNPERCCSCITWANDTCCKGKLGVFHELDVGGRLARVQVDGRKLCWFVLEDIDTIED